MKFNARRGWQTAPLEELCKTASGGTPSRNYAAYFGGNIPWVKSGELRDGLVTKTEEHITSLGLENSSAKMLPVGTLMIALYGATVGKLGILGMEAATNQAVCALFPGKELFPKFVFYFLLAQRENLIEKRTGGAQPNISQEVVRALPIAFPDVPEQKRIAGILERADRLRRVRRSAVEMAETILAATFLGLFGDPVVNSKGWPQAVLLTAARPKQHLS
jgi:type I restriction enzyme S subunit